MADNPAKPRTPLSDTRWLFDLLYLRGRTPWDTEITPPEVVEMIEGCDLKPGRALDLGCGTGTNCVYLTHQGWRTVGVDYSLVAIWRARRRVRREDLDVRFHRADVTHMPFLGEPFDFVLDIGCLHSVPPDRRADYAGEVVQLARPGALFMLYAFLPAERNAGRGITPQDVRELFARAFVVERQEGAKDPNGPRSAWYWMRRVEDAPTDER
jgi:SAM-dependent methyltransferase